MRLEKPKELAVKMNSLADYLDSKYQYKMNTESLRQEILVDIENWYMQNENLWTFERDENYRKNISKQIEQSKLSYYTNLVHQSGLDDKTQRDMILKYKMGNG